MTEKKKLLGADFGTGLTKEGAYGLPEPGPILSSTLQYIMDNIKSPLKAMKMSTELLNDTLDTLIEKVELGRNLSEEEMVALGVLIGEQFVSLYMMIGSIKITDEPARETFMSSVIRAKQAINGQ